MSKGDFEAWIISKKYPGEDTITQKILYFEKGIKVKLKLLKIIKKYPGYLSKQSDGQKVNKKTK